MHKLKKYPNRRLYDMTDSKYVTVDDVRRMIIRGESISVIDSKDESDLTRSVLLQILAEQEQGGTGTVLTNRTIEQLIRFYDDRLGRVASRYIEEAISTYLEHQGLYRDRMRQLNALNPLNLMKQAFDGFAPPSGSSSGASRPSATRPAADSSSPTQSEVDDSVGDETDLGGEEGKSKKSKSKATKAKGSKKSSQTTEDDAVQRPPDDAGTSATPAADSP